MLKEIFARIFSDIPSDKTIGLFSFAHFVYIFASIIFCFILFIIFHNKTLNTKIKLQRVISIILISVYIFDFFVQPIYFGEMRVGKLPFHLCTILGCLAPIASFNKKLQKVQPHLAILAFLASLIFIIFPGNYLDQFAKPYSYTFIQTFSFHILLLFWGLWSIYLNLNKYKIKDFWIPILILLLFATWATFGNHLYYGNELGENFMFMKVDIFSMMGIPNSLWHTILFSLSSIILFLIYLILSAINKKNKTNDQHELNESYNK